MYPYAKLLILPAHDSVDKDRRTALSRSCCQGIANEPFVLIQVISPISPNLPHFNALIILLKALILRVSIKTNLRLETFFVIGH